MCMETELFCKIYCGFSWKSTVTDCTPVVLFCVNDVAGLWFGAHPSLVPMTIE